MVLILLGGEDITEVMEQISATAADLDTVEFAVQSGVLRPAPGQTRDDALALLNLASKQFNNTSEKLKTVARSSPKQVSKVAKDVAFSVSQLVTAVKAVASTTADKGMQGKIVANAKAVNNAVQGFIDGAKKLRYNVTLDRF